ncbi:MAG TPA: septal ring lytic transglycosylase RlpA family protein [Polyangiaceae bacterium]|jgi:rare lipoprotein A|nr:septal ring lytic transglycosylase RlpA family protein [Polyangiaceae bacterium]
MRGPAHRRDRSFWFTARIWVVVLGTCTAGCAHTQQRGEREPAYETAAGPGQPVARAEVQVGYATWYGAALAGHRTASGERFDPSKMTAAHRTLPLGTWVEVTRIETGESVRVRITDRGPFGHKERIIDLSREAARELGMLKTGVAQVKVTILEGETQLQGH